LVPALDHGAADVMRQGELALADAPIVGLEDLQAIGLGGSQARPDAGELMPEIAIAVRVVVLGYRQVQHHELIALAGMLERALVRGLDPHGLAGAVRAGGPPSWPGPDVNALSALYVLHHRPSIPRIESIGDIGIASIKRVLRKNKSNEYSCPPLIMKSHFSFS